MIQQATVASPISATGIGLHNNIPVRITLNPAPADTGIVFQRTDLTPPVAISVTPEAVGETQLCTTLVKGTTKVSTIEHLMSALFGMGIDNVRIDIDAEEVPILDGSAAYFIFLLQSAGVRHLNAAKKFVRITKPVEVSDAHGNWAKLIPYDGFRLTFTIDFDHPSMVKTHNEYHMDFSAISYSKEVSRARTFGFARDADALRKQQRALGGSVNNAVIFDDEGIVNDQGLRFGDEPVKHKMLDAVGDLFAFGYSMIGAFSGYRSGHALNNKLLRAIQADPDAWEICTFEHTADVPINFITSKVI